MSKMSELNLILDELRLIGEKLIALGEKMETGCSEPEHTYTREEVRQVLADKCKEGHTEKTKALFTKYGAEKLSDLDSKYYAAVVAEAEAW